MGPQLPQLTRRHFLYGTAVAAGAAAIAGCSTSEGAGEGSGGGQGRGGKGSATKPLPTPSEFHEAPMLADQVKAGDLPPVEERLPENPYVVPHNWLEAGKYGGTMLMVTPATSGDAANSNREYCYGHSLLRWLNDGLDIGPGLVESWESNEDTSEWTLHFRKGMKWSDGEPWSTADIMFWWEDMVLNEDHSEVTPDEGRSGKGTLMNMTAPDDVTIIMSFDAPAPLTADRLAMWVKGGAGTNGPTWMLPKHYLSQYHPKYNKSVGKDWASAGGDFESKRDWATNPECPTMTGWQLKSIQEGRQLILERNPYYWCVDRDGNQLPFIDMIHMSAVADKEVAKLQIEEGKVDYVHGPFASLTLADVSGLQRGQSRTGLGVRFWDDGGGAVGAACVFFSYDYHEPKMREVIRNPKFRQALSIAHNRKELQKALFFNTGELTTGTMSPKAMEFQVNAEGRKVYRQWRDSWVDYDPEKAKRMLDDIGIVDKNDDGFRELPDGDPLEVDLVYASDASELVVSYNNRMRKDWEEVGIKTKMTPQPLEAIPPKWESGLLMTDSDWGVGDGPNCLVYPQWLVPMEQTRWAPLHGRWYSLLGTSELEKELDVDPYKRTPPRVEPEPDGPIDRIWKLYDQSKVEFDEMARTRLVWEIIKIHIEDGPFFQGSLANTPSVIVVSKDLRNIPEKKNLALGGFTGPWIHPTPAVYDPEAYFFVNPGEHA